MRIKRIFRVMKEELDLNGKPIPPSHFPDLLRSLYKRNQSMNFTGLAEVESMLREFNASPSLVSLKDAVSALSKQKTKAGSSHPRSGKGLSYKHKSLSVSTCPRVKNLDSFMSFSCNHSFLVYSFVFIRINEETNEAERTYGRIENLLHI